MKFRFLEIPNKDPLRPPRRKPFLPIRLMHETAFQDVYCLIDSGADVCLMPASLGELVGIDIKSGREVTISGIGEQGITAYYHRVHLVILGLAGFDTDVGFTYSPGVRSGILGQTGFFDNFTVLFDRSKDFIDVRPVQPNPFLPVSATQH